MRRAIFTLVALLGAMVGWANPATGLPAQSEGCQLINSPSFDSTYSSGFTYPVQFFAGETISATAAEPTGGAPLVESLQLEIPSGSVVDTAAFPGEVTYTFAADTITTVSWSPLPAAGVQWTVACEFGPVVVGPDVEMKVVCAPFVNFGSAAGGIAYKCVAIVAAEGAGVMPAPTGAVTFHQSSASGPSLGQCTLTPVGPGGLSSCQFFGDAAPIPNGPQTIAAVYSGDVNYPSASATDDVGAARTNPHRSETIVLCAQATGNGAATCMIAVADDDRGNDPDPLGTINLYSVLPFTTPQGACELTPMPGSGGLTFCTITTAGLISEDWVMNAEYSGNANYVSSTDSDRFSIAAAVVE